MNKAHFVKETTYGSLPKHDENPGHLNEMTCAMPTTSFASSSSNIGPVYPQKSIGVIYLSRTVSPGRTFHLSIVAPKQIKQLFGCERIVVEVGSVDLEFASGPVMSTDEGAMTARGYKLPGTRVVKLKAGKRQVNLKRWEPIVTFETEAPEPRWPRIIAAALWVAKNAGMQGNTKVDIYCGPQGTNTLQVKFK